MEKREEEEETVDDCMKAENKHNVSTVEYQSGFLIIYWLSISMGNHVTPIRKMAFERFCTSKMFF